MPNYLEGRAHWPYYGSTTTFLIINLSFSISRTKLRFLMKNNGVIVQKHLILRGIILHYDKISFPLVKTKKSHQSPCTDTGSASVMHALKSEARNIGPSLRPHKVNSCEFTVHNSLPMWEIPTWPATLQKPWEREWDLWSCLTQYAILCPEEIFVCELRFSQPGHDLQVSQREHWL